MAAVAFDTFKFIKILTDSGMSEAQAVAISDAVHTVHETADLATKADLRELRHDMEKMEARLDAKIDALEERMNAKIELLGKTMVIKLGSLMVVGLGVSSLILGIVMRLLA